MSTQNQSLRYMSTDYWNRPGLSPIYIHSSQIVDFSDEVTYAANVPGWREKMRLGEGVTTRATGRKIRVRQTFGGASLSITYPPVQDLTYVYILSGFSGSSLQPGIGPTFNSTTYNSALSQIVTRIRQVQSHFQAGVFLGELRETIGLIRRPYKVFRSLSKTYHGEAKRLYRQRLSKREFSRRLGSAYLSYAFGVKPLLRDIDDAMKDLAQLTVGKPPTKLVKAFSQDSVLTSSFKGEGSPLCFNQFIPTIHEEIRQVDTVLIRANVRCLLPRIENIPTSAATRVALSEFIPTVWELIPFSFLVDYFTNVGDIISALTFLESSVVWSNYTKRATLVSKQYYVSFRYNKANYPPPWSENTFDSRAGGTEYSHTKWERDVIGSYVPSLQFTLPGFGDKKWLNMTALLASVRSI